LTDDRAFGADDVASRLYSAERLRKLRFLMTDNTQRAGITKAVRPHLIRHYLPSRIMSGTRRALEDLGRNLRMRWCVARGNRPT
jgi:hypothetical protein